MLRASNGIVLLLGLALVAGCNQSTGTDTDLGTTADAGDPGTDAGTPGDAAMCANTVPTTGFGTRVGANFRDFTLNDCNGNPYTFYAQPDYCSSTLTVLVISAGWCHPCNLESDQLESMLIGPYGPRGVRVIQVLTQDDNGNTPETPGFCTNWLARTNPASLAYQSRSEAATHALSATDHITLLDPTGVTQIYNPANSIPATVIIDGDGVIQLRFNGTNTDPASGDAALTDMTTCLDKLLSTPRQLCH